jgi:predicted RNase H-like nuclease
LLVVTMAELAWNAIKDTRESAVVGRIADCQARPIPEPPETFSNGLACAIWT